MPDFRIDLQSDNSAALKSAKQYLDLLKQIDAMAGKAATTATRAAANVAKAQTQTSDAAGREAAKVAANAERWVAREYRDRLKFETAKQREIDRTAATATREAQRIAANAERWVAREYRDRVQFEKRKQAELERTAAKKVQLISREEAAEKAYTAIIQRENQRRIAAAMNGAAGGGGVAGKRPYGAGAGRSLLEVGRVVQDFSAAGMLGVVNNIEGLTLALGLGTGLAGVLTLVGVAGQIALPHIQKFLAALVPTVPDVFADSVVRIQDRIKELEEMNPITLSVEAEELARLEEDMKRILEIRSQIERFSGGRSKAEVASGKAIEEALAERPGGGAGVIDEVLRQREIQGQPIGTKVQQARMSTLAREVESAGADVSQLQKAGFGPGSATYDADAKRLADAQQQLKMAREQARATERERIGGIFSQAAFGEAEKDPSKRKGQAFYQAQAAQLAEEAGLGDVATLYREQGVGATAGRLREEQAGEALEKERREAEKAAGNRDKAGKIQEKLAGGGAITEREKAFLQFHPDAAAAVEAAGAAAEPPAPKGFHRVENGNGAGGVHWANAAGTPVPPPPGWGAGGQFLGGDGAGVGVGGEMVPAMPGGAAAAGGGQGGGGDPAIGLLQQAVAHLATLAGNAKGGANVAPPPANPPRGVPAWKDRP